MKLCTYWLKASRLLLNVEKWKLLIFQPKRKQIEYGSISIKLDCYKLDPAEHDSTLSVGVDFPSPPPAPSLS